MNVDIGNVGLFHSQALAAGRELKELSREAIRGLDNVMKERNCPMFGAPA